jgi:hypothetical protein
MLFNTFRYEEVFGCRTSNVNVVQPEAEVEEPPPNVANEFNPNEIVRDPGRRKQIHTYSPDIQGQVRRAYILKGPMQPNEIVEQFIALHHVKDTTSEALNNALYCILDHYKLSISRIRGQGYDGASNMRGEFNGLQRKILAENPYAFYVHCYAHHLQLVIVSVVSSCSSINDFFEYISLIVTTSSTSCKRRDALTETQHKDKLAISEGSNVVLCWNKMCLTINLKEF